MVIEGEFLKFCLDKTQGDLEGMFMELALACKCVVCCRVTPAQKVNYLPRLTVAARRRCEGEGVRERG